MGKPAAPAAGGGRGVTCACELRGLRGHGIWGLEVLRFEAVGGGWCEGLGGGAGVVGTWWRRLNVGRRRDVCECVLEL